MFMTNELARLNMPKGLSGTSADAHFWWTVQIDLPQFFFLVSLKGGTRGEEDEIAGASMAGTSNHLLEYMTIPKTTVVRVDLFTIDLDNYPGYNNHRITSIDVGKGSDDLNPDWEFYLLKLKTADGETKQIFDDAFTEDPPKAQLSNLYNEEAKSPK